MLSVLLSLMVVKHIKINNANREALEKLLAEQQTDWNSILIFGLVLVIGVVGLLMPWIG